ncbi:mitochondrial pyruvate dehydrogenase kinase-like protein [Lindgomyces ingoldianus]|uniref:Mitochondrial pyruvate dehydrogenase kinase-like protein n=1 Tax=Lindgomyces ingoldianus TaxID=673940 RepID=A0ACB6R1T5_9PLEO|nr:mitochondrial pyruvate dehydrogenase kinase-like protein [Lindgomyces ingoldianus]KAF2473012.1 mitochondrial pyruvate dehydrogenase kinase-like protein [Lindgomyces ingoldianus]
MAQVQRPLIIQSQFIRLCCPRNARKTPAFSRARHHQRLHTSTVTDNDIVRLASLPLHPLTLADLVKHGRPPLTTSQLLTSANFTLSILPARLAHRIQSLRNLPFIVVSNPNISKIHSNYIHSLSTLLPWAEREITTVEEEVKFTEVMADLVQTHSNTISILARGFLEARKYIGPKDVTRFLDEHLRARIGTRLIAEQHLALHFSSQPHHDVMHDTEEEDSSFIGVIDTKLRPAKIVQHCENVVGELCELRYGVRPHVVINGEPDYSFAHVPVHLEYIITELLKNAFRATVESGMEREPIEITIAPLPEDSIENNGTGSGAQDAARDIDQGNTDIASRVFTSKPISTSPSSDEQIRPLAHCTPGVTIRIRDRGGGISPDVYPHIWDYSFTTFNEDQVSSTLAGGSPSKSGSGMDALSAISGAGGDGVNSLAGLGYGLPLGRAYAEYFGGGIAVQSLWGWGTDVYLSLRGVGKIDD